MRFSVAAVFTFAIGALAVPTVPTPPGGNNVQVSGDTCGENLELSCCNKVTQTGDQINDADGILAGALSGLLEGGQLGLFEGCSKLTVTALIGIDDLLNSQCKQNVACCQHSGTNQEGLVNVGLPCVALSSLI